MNVNNNNGKDVKAEDGEIIDDVHHKYIGNEYKSLLLSLD